MKSLSLLKLFKQFKINIGNFNNQLMYIFMYLYIELKVLKVHKYELHHFNFIQFMQLSMNCIDLLHN